MQMNMDISAALSAANSQEQQEQSTAALDICIQHHLAAEDVVRLWASSRVLQQLCSSRVSCALLVRSLAAVAPAEVAAAATAGPADECNGMQALRWLLRHSAVTAAAINQCSQQLLAIPRVPFAAAEALVRAGLRVQITAQQLVACAYECFEGFEVWVVAFCIAGVPLQEWAADLPEEMRLLCCGRPVSELLGDQVGAEAAILHWAMP
jgi:hypothetical protein